MIYGPREVFLLEHVHVLDDGEESVKTIGIYSTREKAQQAVERLGLQPGFRDAPDGFVIDLYWVDQDCWEDGYVTLPCNPPRLIPSPGASFLRLSSRGMEGSVQNRRS
jgi:hypothetical protein